MSHTTCNSASEYVLALSQQLARLDTQAIDAYAEIVYEAWADDRQVIVFGNGGSAYAASHHVTDYVKTASIDGQRRLRAISLVDNVGLLTAIGNDLSYDDVFRHGLESYGRSGDVAVAISCSGNSPNVVNACTWARENGHTVVAITGFDGGRLAPLAHVHVNVPSDNYGIIEDVQLSIGHMVAQSLQARVLARPSGTRGSA
jgi:D-sedoheptulose 7-phosphate isomerase